MVEKLSVIYDLYRSRHMQIEPSRSCLEQNLAPAPVSNANEKTQVETGLWFVVTGPLRVLPCLWVFLFVFCFVFSLPNDSRSMELLQRQFRKSSCPHTQVGFSH